MEYKVITTNNFEPISINPITTVNASPFKFTAVKYNDPILKQTANKISFSDSSVNTYMLMQEMREYLEEKLLEAVAAPQLGLPYNMFIFKHLTKGIVECYNAKVVDSSPEEIFMVEGSPNWPGLNVKVKRPEVIKCRYMNDEGQIVTEIFGGKEARLVQMMIDVCNGIEFLDRANYLNKNKALREWKKIQRVIE
jgi:peptide deformylase